MNTDLAYIAGFFDGEGTVCLHKDCDTGKIYPELVFWNTDKPVLEWIQKKVNYGVVNKQTAQKESKKERYYITIRRGKVVTELLNNLLPYLKIKKEKAMEAIKIIKNNQN